jgi:hypothetical protein
VRRGVCGKRSVGGVSAECGREECRKWGETSVGSGERGVQGVAESVGRGLCGGKGV